MKKLFLSMIVLIALFLSYSMHAFIPLTVSLDPEDRVALKTAEKSLNEAADSLKMVAKQIESNKISKILTQGGIVLTSTATSILSAYAVFLIIRYELARQPDAQEPRKSISWKTALAGTIGTAFFTGSLVALIKSSAIADYTIIA